MKLTVPSVLIAGIGALLIWCGVTGRDPIITVKAILTGQPIPAPGDVGSGVGGAASGGIIGGANAIRAE